MNLQLQSKYQFSEQVAPPFLNVMVTPLHLHLFGCFIGIPYIPLFWRTSTFTKWSFRSFSRNNFHDKLLERVITHIGLQRSRVKSRILRIIKFAGPVWFVKSVKVKLLENKGIYGMYLLPPSNDMKWYFELCTPWSGTIVVLNGKWGKLCTMCEVWYRQGCWKCIMTCHTSMHSSTPVSNLTKSGLQWLSHTSLYSLRHQKWNCTAINASP